MIDPSIRRAANGSQKTDRHGRLAERAATDSARSGHVRTFPSLSVIFPAFNEENNIRDTVESAREILPDIADIWEIIVVNDGSVDNTHAICEELIRAYPDVRVVHHKQNRGYGAALTSGVLEAKHDLIFFTDSDGQFDLHDLEQFMQWSDAYDIVIGYRGKRRDPLHRLINAFGWNVLVRLVLGLRVRDIDCAFKLFQRTVFDRVQIRSVGAMVNTEILAQATSLGMSIREVEVNHFPRRYGKPSGANLGVIIKAFRELMRLWRQLRNVTDEQAGLFSIDTSNTEVNSLRSGRNRPQLVYRNGHRRQRSY